MEASPLGRVKRGLGGMIVRGGATVAASMQSGGLILTVPAKNHSESCPEYTRCTPCPLTLVLRKNSIKSYLLSLHHMQISRMAWRTHSQLSAMIRTDGEGH